ncbi:MAG TPA: CBS domain-containing protein [Kofleriaceae bacterium]|nr:CBS domain-containing protein [Kofleriaceae bacterium]
MTSLASELFDEVPTAVLDTLGSLIARPALAVSVDTPVGEVCRMLLQYRVPAIAVVDDEELCGVITRSDVLRAYDESNTTAGEAMSNYVFVLPARSTIEKAAALMAYECVGQVLVTGDDGELVGMVSALDVARHYAVEHGYVVD